MEKELFVNTLNNANAHWETFQNEYSKPLNYDVIECVAHLVDDNLMCISEMCGLLDWQQDMLFDMVDGNDVYSSNDELITNFEEFYDLYC